MVRSGLRDGRTYISNVTTEFTQASKQFDLVRSGPDGRTDRQTDIHTVVEQIAQVLLNQYYNKRSQDASNVTTEFTQATKQFDLVENMRDLFPSQE